MEERGRPRIKNSIHLYLDEAPQEPGTRSLPRQGAINNMELHTSDNNNVAPAGKGIGRVGDRRLSYILYDISKASSDVGLEIPRFC